MGSQLRSYILALADVLVCACVYVVYVADGQSPLLHPCVESVVMQVCQAKTHRCTCVNQLESKFCGVATFFGQQKKVVEMRVSRILAHLHQLTQTQECSNVD